MKTILMRKLVFFVTLFCAVGIIQAQVTVSGTVSDESGPLPGANVLIKGTTNGTQTDFDGIYTLNNVAEDDVLVFSYIGYKNHEVAVSGQTTVNVVLEQEAETLEEVVLVGYGTQKRKSVTTSVAKVKSDDFNQGVATNALDLVNGKVAGLQITRAGGNDPNGSTSVQIRGAGSVNGDSSPLIVIDGIPGGSLDLLQQSDIESFDILKDGAAAAIYGTRGNNGVILITTKKGRSGKTSFEYSTYVSKDFVNKKPKFLSADQYRKALNEGKINGVDYGYSTDIFDALVNDSNLSQYHNFAASGGGENGNYRVSVYYRDLEGIALENEREEFGYRISFNQSAFDNKLNFQGSVSTNFNKANLLGGGKPNETNLSAGGQFGILPDWNPTFPIYAPFNESEEGKLVNLGKYGFYQPNNGYNPFSEFANRLNERQQETFAGNAKLSYEFFEGFQVSAFVAYQRDTWNDRYYRSSEDWTQYNDGSEWNGTGYGEKANHLKYTKTLEPTINYTTEIGDHHIGVLGGYSYQYSTTEEFGIKSGGFTTDAFEDWNFGAGNAINDDNLPTPELRSFKEDNTLIAFFSRINYAFKEKYFFQASIRHEGSSKFGKNHKWGNFPAVSGGWLISDEEFMEGVNVISSLKLRAGYGITGNQGIDNYQSLVTLGTGGKYPIYNNGEYTYYQTYGANKNPNPDLRWEKKKELDIGVDFGLFNNVITGSIDYYNRKTEDLLLSYTVPQPPYVQPSIFTNVGTIGNNGVELVLHSTPVYTDDFSWSIDATGSYQTSKLEKLSNDVFIASEITGGGIGNPGNLGDAVLLTEGSTIGDFWGKRFAGFTEDGEWLFYKADGTKAKVDEIAPKEDNAVIGNGLPKYYASLTNTFKYKKFDLTLYFRGKFDYDILNTVSLFYANPNVGGNVLTSALKSPITEAPQYSDYYLESGDFVKLDNVTLGYNFDTGEKSPFNMLRLYISARNLLTFTGYSGRDPEVQDTGLYPGIDDRNFYPRTTTVTAGINVKF